MTELLTGHSLADYIDCAALPVAIVAGLGATIAEALAYSHRAGIIHRDIKPENVFLEDSGRVVLIDFGVAKGMRESSTRVTLMRNQTKLVGTAIFASPEQLGVGTVGPASDIFSLGSVLFYLASQVLPFPAENLIEIADGIRYHEPLPLDRVVEAPVSFARALSWALAKDPALRPSADKLAQALREGAHADLAAFVREHALSAQRKPRNTSLTDTNATIVGRIPSSPQQADLRATHVIRERANNVQKPKRSARPWLLALCATSIGTALMGSGVAVWRRYTRGAQEQFRSGDARSASVTNVMPSVTSQVVQPEPAPSAEITVPTALVPTAPVPTAPAPTAPAPVAPAPVAPPSSIPAPASEVVVRVVVKPWGHVFIDDVGYGTTPHLRELRLRPGPHRLRIENPDYPTRERMFEVVASDAPQKISVELAH